MPKIAFFFIFLLTASAERVTHQGTIVMTDAGHVTNYEIIVTDDNKTAFRGEMVYDGYDITSFQNNRNGDYGMYLGIGFGASVMAGATVIGCGISYTGSSSDTFTCVEGDTTGYSNPSSYYNHESGELTWTTNKVEYGGTNSNFSVTFTRVFDYQNSAYHDLESEGDLDVIYAVGEWRNQAMRNHYTARGSTQINISAAAANQSRVVVTGDSGTNQTGQNQTKPDGRIVTTLPGFVINYEIITTSEGKEAFWGEMIYENFDMSAYASFPDGEYGMYMSIGFGSDEMAGATMIACGIPYTNSSTDSFTCVEGDLTEQDAPEEYYNHQGNELTWTTNYVQYGGSRSNFSVTFTRVLQYEDSSRGYYEIVKANNLDVIYAAGEWVGGAMTDHGPLYGSTTIDLGSSAVVFLLNLGVLVASLF